MDRHQRLQRQTVDSSLERLPQRSLQASSFQTQGFRVQKKAATSAPASKTELWDNYQATKQLYEHGARALSIQAKLTIGQPGDKSEREADSVAERVMAMSEPAQLQREELGEEKEELQMKPLVGTTSPLVQREELLAEEEELQMKSLNNSIQREASPEEEEKLQMKEATTSNPPLSTTSLEDRLSSSKGGGSPLSDDVRSFMETRFGADFSGVRVHTGSDAVQMNRDVNAQAFAYGSDVYFGAGKAPGKDALTAHELTHVVQQTGGVQSILSTDQLNIQQKCSVCKTDEEFLQRTPAMSTDPNFSPPGPGSTKCTELFQKILDFINGGNGIKKGLVERFMDMLNDVILYKNYRNKSNPHPTKGSWDGHVEQYENQRRGLNKKLSDWIKYGCDGPGGPPLPVVANEWADKTAPEQPQNVSLPDSASSPEPAFSYTTIRNVAIALGISVTLIGLIVIAVFDPEPLSKLTAIGLTVATANALMIALGLGKAANVY